MTKPDILLKEDRISVVGGSGPETTGGTERGDVEIKADQGDTPSIRLNADRANLTLGGGTGNAPEGDLKVRDESGDLRIQVTAETGNRTAPGEDRVWIDGGEGEIALGDDDGDLVTMTATPTDVVEREERDFGRISVLNAGSPNWRGVELEGDGSVTVGQNGTVDLLRTLDPSLRTAGTAISLDAETAAATLGGGGASGRLELKRYIDIQTDVGIPTGPGVPSDSTGPGDSSTPSGPSNPTGGPERTQEGLLTAQTVEIDAETASATIGGRDRNGLITVEDVNGSSAVEIDAERGGVFLKGGPFGSGFLGIRSKNGNMGWLSAYPHDGQSAKDIRIYSMQGNEAIRIKPDGTVEFPNTSGVP